MEKKYLDTESKVNACSERLEKLDGNSKEQDKRDTKQEVKLNMLDDRLTHFEITVKTIEA
jgi:hypothetical protein